MDLAEAAQLAQRAGEKAQERRADLTRREAERDAHLSGVNPDEVTLPKDAVRALLAVWDAWENADVYDSEGQAGIYLLLGTEGGRHLDDVHEAATPHVEQVRATLSQQD